MEYAFTNQIGFCCRRLAHRPAVIQRHPPVLPLALAILFFFGFSARVALAHPLNIGYLRIEAKGTTISMALDLDVAGVHQIPGIEGALLDESSVKAYADLMAEATYRNAALSSDLGPCRFTGVSARLTGNTVTLTDGAECPTGSRRFRWAFPFVEKAWVASTFQLLVRARVSAAEHVATIDKSNPEITLDSDASVAFADFVWSGVEHIGATLAEWRGPAGLKLPDGIDHILFLLGLILGGGTLLELVAITSGFTVGHSITLALATLGLVRLPSRLIESVIALSIAFVAAQAFLGKFEKQRWKLASCFGLVHGFGFASALTELNLSGGDLVKALFGFNLGVELGQIAIVVVIAPLVLLAQRDPRVKRVVVRGLAALIFFAGTYWFFERALALGVPGVYAALAQLP
jgi:hypothetical protein